jgi:hypothetical protein
MNVGRLINTPKRRSDDESEGVVGAIWQNLEKKSVSRSDRRHEGGTGRVLNG